MDIDKTLNKVISLIQEEQSAINQLKRLTFKRIGKYEVALSPTEKQQTYIKIKKFYSQKVNDTYASINRSLAATGKDILENPFKEV